MTIKSERNWTIVQLLYRDPCSITDRHPGGWTSRCEKYVTYTPYKSEARVRVNNWLSMNQSRRENLASTEFYPRNYVSMEQDLRVKGRVI